MTDHRISPTDACRICIADRNPVVRAGLRDFLGKQPGFEVVDTVDGGNAFVGRCESGTVDVGITGWVLPDMTGADLLALVRRRQIATRIVVYTGDTGPAILRRAVKEGAWGFVQKSDDPQVLAETITMVSRGRLSLPYVDIKSLSEDPLQILTVRERELLKALAKGLTNEQIAARTGISHNTVKYHLKNVYDKLAVKNRAMAVALYLSVPDDER